MAGILSKIGKGSRSSEFSPIRSKDIARRVEMLDTLEQADLSWFWACDAEGRMIYLSPAALKRLRLTEDDVVGTGITDFFLQLDESMRDGNERPMKFILAARSSISPTTVRVRGDRGDVWWEIAAKPSFTSHGDFNGLRGIVKDVSSTFESQRNAERLAQYDSLTGLANRHRMSSQLDKTLVSFRASERSCALMMLDLDRFKQVNDTLGHPAGDELLKQVAARLKRVVGEGPEIGRLGGDEFQIILPDKDDRGELGDLGQRIVQMLSQPYSINGMRAVIGTSIGIAIAPYDGIDTEELVKAADLALYAAKGDGRGQYRFYSTDLKDSVNRRHLIEEELRDAIQKDGLEVHFQPIVCAKDHRVKAMEALLRWNHAERGMISPAEFIPVAEEVGIIRELGEWVLNHVCKIVSEWPPGIIAAINVSAVQFASDDFLKIVEKAIKKSGVNPAQIELEITESVFIGDLDRTLKLFKDLKGLGVRLSLDDFGTGYSSLSYLRNAPFDKIKIDQSFVRGCAAPDNNNTAIIAAIVSLAKALGMDTVAEGVETKDELKFVTAQGAMLLQGILFSRAIPIDEVMRRFETQDLKFVPKGPEKYRADRRSEFRKIGLIHGDYRYNVFLRNLSKTGAKVEGLQNVPVGTDVVLDLGGGQLAVATVRRTQGHSLGLEFETPLISDGRDSLCTRHRVSPYQIAAAGAPLESLSEQTTAPMPERVSSPPPAFIEVDPRNSASAA